MGPSAQGDECPTRQLPRAWRITKGPEIRSVIQRGKRSRTAHLDVFVSASPVPHSRVGLIVPRHRHSAVKRNRLKRQLREVIRVELLPRLERRPPIDFLVRARREAYGAAFGMLREELVAWVNQLWSPKSS